MGKGFGRGVAQAQSTFTECQNHGEISGRSMNIWGTFGRAILVEDPDFRALPQWPKFFCA